MKNCFYMKKNKTVAVTGLRKHKLYKKDKPYLITEENIKKRIKDQLELAINDGFDTFMTGMATGADTIFANVVIELKEKYDFITLEAIVPNFEQASKFSKPDRLVYGDLLAKCDVIRFTENEYTKDSYLIRNNYLVENASLLIAVTDNVNKIRSGTTYTINRAKEKGVKTIVLNPFE